MSRLAAPGIKAPFFKGEHARRQAVVLMTSHKSSSPHADQTAGRPSWHTPPPHAVPTTCVCNYTHHSLTAPPAAVTHSPPALPSRSARRAALVIKSFGGTAPIDGESSRRVGGGGEGGGEEGGLMQTAGCCLMELQESRRRWRGEHTASRSPLTVVELIY